MTISLAGGGAERSCALLSQMLDRLGYEVHIATLNDRVSYPYSGRILNLGSLKKGRDNPWRRYLRLRKLRTYLRQMQIDLVIDHRPKNEYYRELFYHRYIYSGFKCIYVTHSANKSVGLTQKPAAFVRIGNQIAGNVAVSDHIRKSLLQGHGIQRAITIHNPYDPSWALEGGSLPAILKGKRFVLSYGRLDDEVKDYRFLLQAFERSGLWRKGIFLVIMGEGPDKQMLRDLSASSSCREQVVFLPHQAQPFALVKAAHCVPLTSRFEGFPMVLLEALSLGTPVISLDIVSGPSEIVRDRENGLLISKRDIAIFAQGLRELFDNADLYRHCKENARDSVREFTLDRIAQKWHKLIQDV